MGVVEEDQVRFYPLEDRAAVPVRAGRQVHRGVPGFLDHHVSPVQDCRQPVVWPRLAHLRTPWSAAC